MFRKWINFQISHCEKFHCRLSKITLHYQSVIDQRLKVFQNCSVGLQLDPWNIRSTKQSVRKAIWQSEEFPEYAVFKLRTLSFKIFSKWTNFQIRHCKKFHCLLRKISLNYQTVIDQRLTVYHQLFSWISAGP